jgi:predicted ester cyclase
MSDPTLERNKAIFRRYLALHAEPDGLDEVISAEVMSHEPPMHEQGIAAVKATITEMRAAFSDIHTELRDLVAEGDRVVARLATTATNTGPFKRFSASGKTIQTERIEIVRIADGKIVERWLVRDRMEVLRQLGHMQQKPTTDN